MSKPLIFGSPRVLYVEPDNDSAQMITTLLGMSGITVSTAPSFSAGLAAAIRNRFDLAIITSRYPDGDGNTLCKILNSEIPGLGVIFYSGVGSIMDVQNGLAAGALEYIVKPYVDELEAAVQRLLSRNQQLAETSQSSELKSSSVC